MNTIFTRDFRKGALFGAVLTAVLFVATGAGRPLKQGFVSGLLKQLASESVRSLGTASGPVLARVESRVIRKAVFEKQYAAFVEGLDLPKDQQGRVQHEKKLRSRFLSALVDDMVFMQDFEKKKAVQRDPGFLFHLQLKFHEAVREYYLIKYVASNVSTKVSDKEVGDSYDKLKADPRYAQGLSRMDMKRVRVFIRRRIVQGRKVAAAKAYMDRLKMRYRIETFEKLL